MKKVLDKHCFMCHTLSYFVTHSEHTKDSIRQMKASHFLPNWIPRPVSRKNGGSLNCGRGKEEVFPHQLP